MAHVRDMEMARARAFGASCLALVYVVTLGLPMLHFVLERHEVCAEHGELTHGAPTHVEAAARVVVADDAPTIAGHDASPHGHCDMPQSSDPALVIEHGSFVVGRSVDAQSVRSLSDGAPRVVRALRFAPKTSPPASALVG